MKHTRSLADDTEPSRQAYVCENLPQEPTEELLPVLDDVFLSNVCHVYTNQQPLRRDIETANGMPCVLNIAPYPSDSHQIKGVVITFSDRKSDKEESLGVKNSLAKRRRRFGQAVSGGLKNLTYRERQILEFILNGHPNKNIAVDLGISQRTVENHRANIMHKTGSKTLSDLFRTIFVARYVQKNLFRITTHKNERTCRE